MRGPASIHRRAGAKLPPTNEANSRPVPAIPAPYGGWNARGNLANMAPTDAIVMDNWFPGVQTVGLRKGSTTWSTGFSANIRALLPYQGPSSDKLFASTNSAIYDVTAGGAIGASVQTCSSGAWSYLNFATSGGNFLCMVNGADAYKVFDGTNWSNPTVSGIPTTSLFYMTAHQSRLWFVEAGSMNLWYLPVQSIAGVASKFPVGAIFKKGGHIVAIGSWSVSFWSGSQLNHLLAIATSNGEIAVYAGIDPNSATTWNLVGVYDVPRPLGNRPFVEYGGELLYLSKVGLFPLSKIAQDTALDDSDAISYQIDQAFLDAATNYGPNFGWTMALHKTANLFLVNIPASTDTLSYQYVMNTITKAWCRFTGWNASCFAVLGDNLYFAGGKTVNQAWIGANDSGVPIVGQVAQAYSPLGLKGQKNITLVRPNISFSNAISLQAAIDADFSAFSGNTTVSYNPASGVAVWDASLWDSGLWDGGQQTFDPKWLSIPGNLGYLHSLRLQITSSQAAVSWTSTDFVLRPAGIL